MKLNRHIALDATFHLFIVLGFVALFSFILTAHWLLVLACIPALAFSWWVLYKFEEGLARRRETHALIRYNPSSSELWQPGLK